MLPGGDHDPVAVRVAVKRPVVGYQDTLSEFKMTDLKPPPMRSRKPLRVVWLFVGSNPTLSATDLKIAQNWLLRVLRRNAV